MDGNVIGTHLVDLDADRCRWPVAEDDDGHLFCGDETILGKAYCRQHHAIAYPPIKLPTARRRIVCDPIRRIERVELSRLVWRAPVL